LVINFRYKQTTCISQCIFVKKFCINSNNNLNKLLNKFIKSLQTGAYNKYNAIFDSIEIGGKFTSAGELTHLAMEINKILSKPMIFIFQQ